MPTIRGRPAVSVVDRVGWEPPDDEGGDARSGELSELRCAGHDVLVLPVDDLTTPGDEQPVVVTGMLDDDRAGVHEVDQADPAMRALPAQRPVGDELLYDRLVEQPGMVSASEPEPLTLPVLRRWLDAVAEHELVLVREEPGGMKDQQLVSGKGLVDLVGGEIT